MKTLGIVFLISFGVAVLILLILPILPGLFGGGLQDRTLCQSYLHSFDLALQTYAYPPVNVYPTNLAGFGSDDVSSEMFFCPRATATRKGQTGIPTNCAALPLSEMAKYTDYIYISGLGPGSPPGIPLIICPPENHDGKGGNVLDTDHSTRWYQSKEMTALIERAYAYAESNGLRVVVGEALTKRSGGRYKSRP